MARGGCRAFAFSAAACRPQKRDYVWARMDPLFRMPSSSFCTYGPEVATRESDIPSTHRSTEPPVAAGMLPKMDPSMPGIFVQSLCMLMGNSDISGSRGEVRERHAV